MAIKELQTRIALKYDSYANWTNADVADQGANLVLLKGELGICEIKATNEQTKDAGIIPTVLFKVGDGETPFKDLPWASAKAADVYAWAKASDLVVEGKSIKFVGVKDAEGNDKKITFNFATPEEVAAEVKKVSDNLAGVDARVVALENKFTGDGSVQGQIDALDGRLDAIEGTEGAIATGDAATLEAAKGDATSKANTAEANAKAYAKEYADGIATEQAKTDAAQDAALEAYKAVVTGLLAGKQDVIPAETYDAYGAAAQALADAKTYADQAEADAIAAAASDAAGKVKALEDGKVAANAAAIEAMDAAYKKAVEDEAKARDDADKAIDERLDKVEAFFEGAAEDSDGLNNALDKLVDIQNYLAGEGSGADGLMGQVSANAQAIEGLSDRMDDAEDAIEALEAADEAIEAEVAKKLDKTTFEAHTTGHAGTATEITTEITNAVNGEKSAREAADTAIEEKIGGSYSKTSTVADAIAGVKTTADTAAADLAALTTRVGTAEGKITTLEGIVNDASKGNEKLRTDVNTLQSLTSGYTGEGAIKAAIEDAKKAGTDAAAAVDALSKGQVATNKTDIATNKASIEAIQADYLKAADVYIFNCGSSTTVTHEATKAE